MDYLDDCERTWQQYENKIAIESELRQMKQELMRGLGKDFESHNNVYLSLITQCTSAGSGLYVARIGVLSCLIAHQ